MYGSTNEHQAGHYVNASPTASQFPQSPQISLPPLHPHQTQDASSPLRPRALLGDDGGSATLTSCVINLANTIIGAGMLGLPGALGGTGYLGGVVLMVLGALFSAHGLQLLSKAAQQAGLPSSFYTVAHAAVPHYTVLIDLAVALKCFGVATGYLITVGDCMVDALDHMLLEDKDDFSQASGFAKMVLSRQFWVVGATFAVLPFSFYRTLDELKKASALALVFVVFLVFGIVAYANQWADPCEDYDEGESCVGDIEPFTNAPRTLGKLPIFVFAFTCHQNVFPIVNEIQHRSQSRINKVIGSSIGLAFGVFLLVALEGYRTFGSNVRGDILLNYPETGKVTVLRICIAFMLTLHYPLQLDPSRRCISSLVMVLHQKWNVGSRPFHRRESDLEEDLDGKANNNSQQSYTNPSEKMFYTITICFLLASFGIAMIVDDLGVVLAMVGATGSTLVSYILPGLIYVKIHPAMDLSKIGAYIQLILGCIIMPVALYFVLTGSANE